MNNSECYLLLEIDENATNEEIKKAYRRKAHQLHPDKNRDTDTTQEFQKLNHAYQILINSKFSTNNYWAEYEKEQEELYEEIDLNKFKINIDNLTCSCRDWKKKRSNFDKNDPRRLCRHIIALFGEKDISPNNYFIGSDESINNKLLNENIDIQKMIYKMFIPNQFLMYSNRIHYNYESKTGFFIFNDSVFFGEYVNIFYENNSHEFGFRSGNVHIYLKNSFEVVLNFDYGFNSGNYTSRFDCKDNFYKICSIEALKEIELFVKKNTDWEEHFYNFKKQYDLIQENKKYFSIDKTMINRSFNYYGLEYKDFKKIKDRYLNQYDNLTNLLKQYNPDLTVFNANKTLLKLGIFHKETNLNRGDYIIKDTYNKYGINYIKSRFDNIQKSIPYWYKVSYFDVDKYRIIESNKTKNIPFTEVLFKIENFNDVYNLIIENTKPTSKDVNKESSIDKKSERESWLKDVECPYCNGKNIHKKDKRQRQNYQIQRYMCIDCNKIFQKKIDENS